MKVAFTARDDSMPRTVYWERFRAAVERNPRFVANEDDADVLLPAEDVALESNWPRYGDFQSAFVRGKFDEPRYLEYLKRLASVTRPLCVVNMHPFVRLPEIWRGDTNIVVADISMSAAERANNPRTISMPTLPIVAASLKSPKSQKSPTPSECHPERTREGSGPEVRGQILREYAQDDRRDILASFRGVATSHACRLPLMKLHDGKQMICEAVEPSNHRGKIDATAGKVDARYAELMRRSVFALVPRGDALFSYRLIEALSFGCIPVVISDGWVLPFDRTIDWTNVAVVVPEANVSQLPRILSEIDESRRQALATSISYVYRRFLSDLDVMVETLFAEVEAIAPRPFEPPARA